MCFVWGERTCLLKQRQPWQFDTGLRNYFTCSKTQVIIQVVRCFTEPLVLASLSRTFSKMRLAELFHETEGLFKVRLVFSAMKESCQGLLQSTESHSFCEEWMKSRWKGQWNMCQDLSATSENGIKSRETCSYCQGLWSLDSLKFCKGQRWSLWALCIKTSEKTPWSILCQLSVWLLVITDKYPAVTSVCCNHRNLWWRMAL